ncbi:hypothetical protein BUALT_Bualt05G0042400 [Buddleja alternifolia]|uniref:G-box binding protein multifunctional mosaic region domain-containing protein n=1 Tax=Buddleja alternifolia TaxID=168488 RepID=A0AAV6XNF8_9LAMI|nr:hypothetical protein BUALT_Bualt05G0042400 [Buddleja alternifolia]
MASSEVDKSSKEGKEVKEPRTPTSQEQTSAASEAVAADWSAFQAYSHMPPHGFVSSSPQPHPYMWGVQEKTKTLLFKLEGGGGLSAGMAATLFWIDETDELANVTGGAWAVVEDEATVGQFIPPYGTPQHPYVAMYPHGGIYAHPTMAPGSYPFSPFAMPSPNGTVEASGNTPANMEVDGKLSEGKEKLPIKRSKGSLGSLKMITGKNNEPGKTSGTSANGVYSKSGESASEGSSEGSDANSQSESPRKSGGRQDSAEPSQNGSAAHSSQNGGSNTPHSMVNHNMAIMPMPATGVVPSASGPTTNLNIGMDYWGAAQSAIPATHGKVPSSTGVQSQHWIQVSVSLLSLT